MTDLKIPYFVAKPGRAMPGLGANVRATRYFWQPAASLRGAGFKSERLPDDLGDAIARAGVLNDQVTAWRAGEQVARSPLGSLTAACQLYTGTRHFTRLAPGTRTQYLSLIKRLVAWRGDAPLGTLTAADCEAFYAQVFDRTPATAIATLNVLDQVFRTAIVSGLVNANPCTLIRRGSYTPAPAALWSAADVAQFARFCDGVGAPDVATAVIANEWLGQRMADLLKLPAWPWPNGLVTITQQKTGARAVLPAGMVPALVDRFELDAARHVAASNQKQAALIANAAGAPYTVECFRRRFRTLRDQAAKRYPNLTGLEFRALRHTAVTRLAEAGSEIPQIAALTGHSLASVHRVLEHYLHRTPALAAGGFQKRLENGG